MYLGLALDAFVAWRAEAGHANFETRLSWKIEEESLEVTWEEALPAGSARTRNPIASALKARRIGQIDSLALPLLAIVSAHGGSLWKQAMSLISQRESVCPGFRAASSQADAPALSPLTGSSAPLTCDSANENAGRSAAWLRALPWEQEVTSSNLVAPIFGR